MAHSPSTPSEASCQVEPSVPSPVTAAHSPLVSSEIGPQNKPSAPPTLPNEIISHIVSLRLQDDLLDLQLAKFGIPLDNSYLTSAIALRATSPAFGEDAARTTKGHIKDMRDCRDDLAAERESHVQREPHQKPEEKRSRRRAGSRRMHDTPEVVCETCEDYQRRLRELRNVEMEVKKVWLMLDPNGEKRERAKRFLPALDVKLEGEYLRQNGWGVKVLG